MTKYIIERNISGVGQSSEPDMKKACRKSNETIKNMTHHVQWQQSYVTDDKLYCVYLAESKEAVQEHAAKSGFPASRIEEVRKIIDPVSAE